MRKQTYLKHAASILFFLCLTAQGFAQLTPSGTWNATTISRNVTVNLTGNVTITGTINVQNGATLTINNNAAGEIRITNGSSGDLGRMFYVQSGATLIINGKDRARIVLDGGANFTWSVDTLIAGSTTKQLGASAIESGGTLTLRHVTIEDFHFSNGDNGAVKIAPNGGEVGKTVLENCTIQRCKGWQGVGIKVNGNNGVNSKPEDCSVSLTDCVIQHCYSADPGDTWCGIIRTNGSVVSNLYLTRTKLTHNYAEAGNAGLFWNAAGAPGTKCLVDGCEFSHNKAGMEGGGIRIETTLSFVNNKTIVHNNEAGTYGGGVHVYGYAASNITLVGDYTYDLNEYLEVYENTAGKAGGGIAFQFNDKCNLPEGTKIKANLNGVVIRGNKVTGKFKLPEGDDPYVGGGGMSFENTTPASKNYTITVNLDWGEVTSNEASKGAGIYVADMDITSNATSGKTMTISENSAVENGGGIYLEDGDLVLRQVNITGNSVTSDDNVSGYGDGGGIYITNGSFTMGKGSVISKNSCKRFGGGLCVANTNTSGNPVSIDFSGGTISENTAAGGGGIAATSEGNAATSEGNAALLTVIIDQTTIEKNEADHGGGGLYLRGNVSMSYTNGLIRNNKATGNLSGDKTMYGRTLTKGETRGVGGGIYLEDGAILDLSQSTGEFGIYGNTADSGGDDILANGNNTRVYLPDVADMTLDDFEVPVPKGALYWVEDYITNDIGYKHGTMKNTDYEKGISRYRDALASLNENFYRLNNTTDLTLEGKYVCLALGYAIIYVTIEKKGMNEGENAVFTILQNGTPYMTLVLSAKDKDAATNTLKKRVALTEGTWTIKESGWTWAYKEKAEQTITLETGDDKTITFVNEKKTETENPLHHEAIKVNTLEL